MSRCIMRRDGLPPSLTLAKGRRERSGEDAVVSRLILNAIAEVAGIDGRVDPGLVERRECFAGRR